MPARARPDPRAAAVGRGMIPEAVKSVFLFHVIVKSGSAICIFKGNEEIEKSFFGV
jgi:hypothetical protein